MNPLFRGFVLVPPLILFWWFQADLESALGACDPSISNPIICENSNPGSPSSEWDIAGAGSTNIQGFATEISVNAGQTVFFKVNTDSHDYRLDIYRLGYYAGAGARKWATITPSASLPQVQPAALVDATTGLVDCGNWAVSASWQVPADAPSGVYIAKLVRQDGTSGVSHIVFVVRSDSTPSDILFQTSDTTWQAYNRWGGNSLYVGSPAGRAYKVSYNRPFATRAVDPWNWVFSAEYPMIRFLEKNGYDVTYCSGVDSDRSGTQILQHKLFLSVGHDEYWSAAQRSSVEAARNAGVHLAFFSGNEIFWKTRWESSTDASATPYRTLVCYKETHANAKIDPTPTWTGTWRDPRFSPPSDGGRPENALSGTLSMVNGYRKDSITVSDIYGKMRFWRNTSVASLPPGQVVTFLAGSLGYEWDEAPDNGFAPPGLVRMSSTTLDVPKYLQDYGSTYAAGTATHHLTLYRHSSGALVFGAGTIQWSWGLDSTHDTSSDPADPRLQQATVNLLADMDVQPGSLQAGLVAASPSPDQTPPLSTILSPSSGATLPSGQAVTITGSASDSGGVVAGVEVSTDGGATWHPAAGLQSWTYQWTPAASATTATILSRAVDDSANLQKTPSSIQVTFTGSPPPAEGGLVSYWKFDESSGTIAHDSAGPNTGTLQNSPSWTTGKLGNALHFSGSSFVDCGSDPSLMLQSQTFAAWVDPDVVAASHPVLNRENISTDGWEWEVQDGKVGFAYFDGAIRGWYLSSGTIPSGTWSHIAGVWTPGAVKFYINGQLDSSKTTPSSPIVNITSRDCRIGRRTSLATAFAGTIDDLRIYNRALTDGEIQNLYAAAQQGSPPPRLAVQLVSPANIQLSWATTGSTFVLEATSNCVSGPWSPVTQTPTVSDGKNAVTISPGAGEQFFRLRQ